MFSLKKLLGAALVSSALLVASIAGALAQGTVPQTSPANFKNLLVGGDFGTNPWQRGTSSVGGNIAATATFTADHWFAFGGASSSINISQSTTAPVGSLDSLQFQRTAANANTAQICIAQSVESAKVIPLQGQPIVLSFSAEAGALFTGTSLTANIITSTTVNQTSANLVTAAWTAQATLATQSIPFTAAANGAAFTRYAPGTPGGPFNGLAAVVPTTAKALAVEICWTPIGTAGATDMVLLDDIQLEIGNTVTAFEQLDPGIVLNQAQRHTVVFVDTGTAAIFPAACQASTTTSLQCVIMLPVPMRAAPTATWSNTTSFGAVCTATNVAASVWAQTASGVQSVNNSITATATIGAVTAAAPCLMIAKNTAVTLTISSEL